MQGGDPLVYPLRELTSGSPCAILEFPHKVTDRGLTLRGNRELDDSSRICQMVRAAQC